MTHAKLSAPEIRVRLVRPGVGDRVYRLPEGSTLADLLRASGASATGQAVLVDGLAAEEVLPLQDGSLVTIAPGLRAAGGEPWRAGIPALRDEALSRDYSEVLRARREADDSQEGPAA